MLGIFQTRWLLGSPLVMAASSLLIVLFALYFQLLVATPLVEQVPPVVDTGYAKYLGSRPYPNTVAYLGIPYAEPPLGDRRWRAAFPLDKHRVSRAANGTIVDATKYGQFCIQGPTNGKPLIVEAKGPVLIVAIMKRTIKGVLVARIALTLMSTFRRVPIAEANVSNFSKTCFHAATPHFISTRVGLYSWWR